MSKSKKESTHTKLADSERAHFLEQGNVTGRPQKGRQNPTHSFTHEMLQSTW